MSGVPGFDRQRASVREPEAATAVPGPAAGNPGPDPATVSEAAAAGIGVLRPRDHEAAAADRSIVRVRGLTKRFGAKIALDNASFDIPTGEVFTVLGRNGAGKTTLVNILNTLISPTSGTAYVCGEKISGGSRAVRKRMGMVFQESTLDSELSVRENLDYHAALYGLGRRARRRRIADLLERFEIGAEAERTVRHLSGGMRRRVEIARGLIHEPSLLFLDEPTVGLDVQTRYGLWAYIESIKRDQETTVVVTTHYLEEIENVAESAIILDEGSVVAKGTIDELIKSADRSTLAAAFTKLVDRGTPTAPQSR